MDALVISLALLMQEPPWLRHPGEAFSLLLMLLAAGFVTVVLAAVLAIFLIVRYRHHTGRRRWFWLAGWIIATALLVWLAWLAALFIR